MGVIIDSLQTTITLNIEKKQNVLNLCTATRSAHTLTIRELAKLIGSFLASMEAVLFGRLFYRQLEKDKIKSLQQSKNNFEAKITLSERSKKELTSWENDIMTATKSLKMLPIDTLMQDTLIHGCKSRWLGGSL